MWLCAWQTSSQPSAVQQNGSMRVNRNSINIVKCWCPKYIYIISPNRTSEFSCISLVPRIVNLLKFVRKYVLCLEMCASWRQMWCTGIRNSIHDGREGAVRHVQTEHLCPAVWYDMSIDTLCTIVQCWVITLCAQYRSNKFSQMVMSNSVRHYCCWDICSDISQRAMHSCNELWWAIRHCTTTLNQWKKLEACSGNTHPLPNLRNSNPNHQWGRLCCLLQHKWTTDADAERHWHHRWYTPLLSKPLRASYRYQEKVFWHACGLSSWCTTVSVPMWPTLSMTWCGGDLGCVKTLGLQWCSDSSSRPGICLQRRSISWCIRRVPVSIRKETICNSL
jgi:hypothetical protein